MWWARFVVGRSEQGEEHAVQLGLVGRVQGVQEVALHLGTGPG